MSQYSLGLKNKKAFTIAEMTVVLLILSIVMAAILPVATNKKTGGNAGGNGSLWKLARNNTDIWFASPGTNQSVLIGTSITPDSHGFGRLYINMPESTTRSQIAMMYNNSTVGYIKFKSGNNIGLGLNPLPSAISTGHDDISVGENSLSKLTTGAYNLGLGYGALSSNTTGHHNNALGYNALGKNTTSSNNVGIGQSALYNNTGACNVGIGELALTTNNSGYNNVGIGRRALYSATTAYNNTAVGNESLYSTSTGINNTSLGAFAGKNNSTGSYNLYLGYESAAYGNKSGSYNTAIGYRSMYSNNTTSGTYNAGVGSYALQNLAGGVSNTAVGHYAGSSITSGTGNTGLGLYSLDGVTTGSYNIGIGNKACSAVTTGSYKSCLGYNAGYSVPSGFHTATTDSEVVINNGGGYIYLHAPHVYSGAGNDATVASEFKVTGSIYANSYLKTGTYANVGTDLTVGRDATITRHLIVGQEARANHLYANRIISRSLKEGSTANQYAMEVFGTFYGPWTPASDKRLKNIEGFANTGLEEVKKLNVYKYTYKNNPETPKIGLIAQDVEKVIPFAVVKDSDGYLAISQENIIYTMFNAIKELDKLYESLKSKFQDYVVRLNLAEDRINALIEVNQNLSKRIDELEKRVNKLEKEYTKLEKKQCKCK